MLNGPPLFCDAKESNQRANNIRIFETTRKLPTSPHYIYVGQRLNIPQLRDSGSDKIKIWGIFPSSMFEQVESIGKRHIPTDNHKVKQDGRYIVREGDNLWRIAAEQLGDGSRYKEISKLNADVLEDDDSLAIGMRLSLPAS
jgi:nucleoid-associated protein YgaU